MKLIVIEDDELFAELIKRALVGLTDSVIMVKSWAEAQPHLAEQQMAWVDLRLSPEVRERESLEHIRNLRQQHSDIVIIVGSGFITPKLREDLHEAGVDAVFHKDTNFSAEQVAAIIIVALMRAEMRGSVEVNLLLQRAQKWMHERHPAIA